MDLRNIQTPSTECDPAIIDFDAWRSELQGFFDDLQEQLDQLGHQFAQGENMTFQTKNTGMTNSQRTITESASAIDLRPEIASQENQAEPDRLAGLRQRLSQLRHAVDESDPG